MKILNRFTGGVLFEFECESMKRCVEAAIGKGANLFGAYLSGADLCGADLHRANLSGADLHRANLSGADLRSADLRGADLRGADLRDADLFSANLSGTDLRSADLRGADLRGADLRDAENIIRVGPTSDGYEVFAVPFNDTVYVKAGCRWFSIEDARNHWEETRGGTVLGKERVRWCDFIEVEAKARNWI